MRQYIVAMCCVCCMFSMPSAHAEDPAAVMQLISEGLRAVSLVDVIAKAGGAGADMTKISTVPRLKVTADCGDCKLSHATKMLITSSYIALAKSNDVTIDSDRCMEFRLTSMFSRNSFLRGTLGLLSGADYIAGHFSDDKTTIREYSVSHEMGIDEITQKLGEDLLKHIITKNIEANIDAVNN